MSRTQIMTSTFLALAVAGVSLTVVATDKVHAADKVDTTIRSELEYIARQRIFFGHQSVGENLLDGIEQLATTTGVPIRVLETTTASAVPAATFGHTFVDRNGDPYLKLRNFEQAFGEQPAGVEIALIKFCYVDIVADTDPKVLFASYRSAIENLRAKNPRTTFVHVTAPLTSEQGGAKEFLKNLLGRGVGAQNMRREEYNSLLRKTYQGREPVFDLARVESIAPDGTTVTVNWNGIVAPAMSSAYTNDGGHLNSVGKLRAARELISVLAAIPERPARPGSTR